MGSKNKRPETTVKKIGNNYYLYRATSRWNPEKHYPELIQTYIGKITEEGHLCLQLKRNQKNAFEDVELFFSDMKKNNSREFSEMDYYMQEGESILYV